MKITRLAPSDSTTAPRWTRCSRCRLGLHVGRGVDIGDDRHAGEGSRNRRTSAPVIESGERAAGAHVRDQHRLVGVEQLRGLGHEVHAALDDDLGIGLGCLARKLQRVADDIGDAMEDLGRHVVVREHDGVARFFSSLMALT